MDTLHKGDNNGIIIIIIIINTKVYNYQEWPILCVLGPSVHKLLANKEPRTIKESDGKLWDNRHPKEDNTHLKKRCLGRYPRAKMLGQEYIGHWHNSKFLHSSDTQNTR